MRRSGLASGLVLLGGIVGLVAVLAAAALVLGAGDIGSGAGDEASDATGATSRPTSTVTAVPTTDAPGSTRPARASFPGLGPEIPVRATPTGGLPVPVSAVGDLTDGDVVPVAAAGFGRDVDGTARQCATDGSERVCTPALPVRFDGNGLATFLFLLADHVDSGDDGHECGGPVSCILEVRDGRGHEAAALLEFDGGASEAPELQVARTSVESGEAVTVSVRGLAPRERVRIVQCAANDDGRSGCGEPGADVAVVADARGAASAELVVREGRVGVNVRVECSRRTTCGIAVVHADGLVRAAPVEVSLAAGPTADYDGTRLLVGLLVALALAAGAVLLGVRTDWRGAPDPFA